MLTFATTTSYGSWLPGDARGWIGKGKVLPADCDVEQRARQTMKGTPVRFSQEDRDRLLFAISAAAREFEYHLLDLTIESWHLHWIVDHGDPINAMMGRLKNRMRQALNRGRIWTAGYCANLLLTDDALAQARIYIAAHEGCRMSGGRLRTTPGRAGG